MLMNTSGIIPDLAKKYNVTHSCTVYIAAMHGRERVPVRTVNALDTWPSYGIGTAVTAKPLIIE